jgi:rhodanese-related sulfurtransferase
VKHAVGIAVTREAVVARGVVRRSRVSAGAAMAGEARCFALGEAVIGVGRQPRRVTGDRPEGRADRCGQHTAEQQPVQAVSLHRRMLPSPAVRRELLRDAALYLGAVAVLGTAANFVPARHMAWWGKGKQPPAEGVDFTFIDPLSAATLRASLPHVVFLDTRSAAQYARDHVPDAVPIAYTDLDHSLTPQLLARLRTADMVIVYGDSAETDVEQLVAQELRLRGLSPPMVLIGGFAAWRASGPTESGEEAAQ